jgi:hypothetical protein
MEAIGSLFRNSLFRAAGRRRRERQQQSQEPQQSNRTADDLEERTPLPPSPSRSPLRKKRNKGGIINATDDAVVEDSAAADLSSQLSQMQPPTPNKNKPSTVPVGEMLSLEVGEQRRPDDVAVGSRFNRPQQTFNSIEAKFLSTGRILLA